MKKVLAFIVLIAFEVISMLVYKFCVEFVNNDSVMMVFITISILVMEGITRVYKYLEKECKKA